LISISLSGGVSASTGTNAAIDAKREERKGVESELGELRTQIDANESENAELENALRELIGERDASEMEYNDLVELLRLYGEMIARTEKALENAENHCDEQRELMKSRVRNMYMNSDGSAIETLLSSRDITSFMEKLELFSVISGHDNEVLENYKAARADVEYKRSIQTSIAEKTGEKAVWQRMELEDLNVSRQELEAKVADLQSTIEQLISLEDELEAQSAKLEEEIKQLVAKAEAEAAEAARRKAEAERRAREEAAATAAAANANAGAGAQSGSQASQSASGMRWPLPGYKTISSAYGNRIHPIKKTTLFHSGIDIPAPTGSNIIAAKAGTVLIARVEGGYGNTVVIDHGGGITTLYGHCSKLLVKAGQKVDAGSTIAKVGSTGVSTGPHLHFEIRKNGSPVNPSGYV
jgi:murein DD-endopeptidase MepM/ murein hydrolase activator NlpD